MIKEAFNFGTQLFKITILFLLLERVPWSLANENEWKCDVQNIQRKKPNSGYCSKYYECKWKGIGDYDLEEISCPDSRIFDPEIGVCLQAYSKFDESKCKKSSSFSSSTSTQKKPQESEKYNFRQPKMPDFIFPDFFSQLNKKPEPSRTDFQRAFKFPTVPEIKRSEIPKVPPIKQITKVKKITTTYKPHPHQWEWKTHDLKEPA